MKFQFKTSKKLFYVCLFIVFSSIFITASSSKVEAASCSWNGATSGNWATTSNWNPGCSGVGGIPGSGDNLSFPNSGSNKTMNNNISSLSLGSLSFGSSSYALTGNAITLSGGTDVSSPSIVPTIGVAITLGADQTFGAGTYNGTIALNGHNLSINTSLGSATFSSTAVISGTGNINISGSSSPVTLGAHNTFTGSINQGSSDLILSNDFSLGNSANTLTVGGGHGLTFSGGITVANNINLATGDVVSNQSGTNTLSGTINIVGTVTYNVATSTTLVFSGVVANSGAFVKIGTGQITFSGSSNNTYSGGLFIYDGTVVGSKTGGVNAFPSNIIVGDDTGAAASAVLSLVNDDQIVDSAAISIISDGKLEMSSAEELLQALNVSSGDVDISSGSLVVFSLTMIGGTINTGTGKIGVAEILSLSSGLSSRATINGDLDFGAISGGIEVTGADGAFTPDALIHADLHGTSDLIFTGGDIGFDGDNHLYTGDFVITAGSVEVNDDNTNTDVSMSGSGNLFGNGIIKSLTVYSGNIYPGNSPGILSIYGDMALSSSDTINIDLDTTLVGLGYDEIEVGGTAYLNNAMLTVNPGSIFASGDTFLIISAAAMNGTFLNLPDGTVFKAGGQFFQIHYLTTGVLLEAYDLILTNPSNTPTTATPGQAFTVTSTWSSNGGIIPTGTAELFEGSTSLGVTTLVGGVATFNNISLSAGTHTLNINYSGDSNFNPATSYDLVINVGTLAGTGISLPVNLLLSATIISVTTLLFIEIKKRYALQKY